MGDVAPRFYLLRRWAGPSDHRARRRRASTVVPAGSSRPHELRREHHRPAQLSGLERQRCPGRRQATTAPLIHPLTRPNCRGSASPCRHGRSLTPRRGGDAIGGAGDRCQAVSFTGLRPERSRRRRVAVVAPRLAWRSRTSRRVWAGISSAADRARPVEEAAVGRRRERAGFHGGAGDPVTRLAVCARPNRPASDELAAVDPRDAWIAPLQPGQLVAVEGSSTLDRIRPLEERV